MAGAYYLPVESNLTSAGAAAFLATEATSGPWDPLLQHGGPPAALLARAAERAPGSWPSTVVRMAVDLLGPVPVGEVTVAARMARSGRSVELIEADLSAGGRVAARVRAWRVRRSELSGLPSGTAPTTTVPTLPPDSRPAPENWAGGFVRSMETRFSLGDWNAPGRATMWARFPLPVVADEGASGLQRLMLLADCGNGVSSALPITEWVFINPELTVHLSRYPQGEWLCIDAATAVDSSGFGLATSTLYDATGEVARGAQSLFINGR